MGESQINHHRLIDCEDHVAFMSEDGINVLGGKASVQTCLNCSHNELSDEGKETLAFWMSKIQKKPQPLQIFIQHQ